MHGLRGILVASDGTGPDTHAFTQALTQALSIARNTGASVAAFIACPDLPRRLAEAYETSLRDKLHESLAAARASLGIDESSIPVRVDVERGDLACERPFARTGVPGFIMGNTAENVIRRLGCSLVALKPPGFASPVKAY